MLLLTAVETQLSVLSSSLHEARAWISRLEADGVVQPQKKGSLTLVGVQEKEKIWRPGSALKDMPGMPC